MSYFIPFLLVGIFARNVLSYPDQVPATDLVCKTMTPGHGPRPQDAAKAPFNVELSTKNVKAGDQKLGKLEVTLKGDSDFKGFYLQCRNNDGVPIGTFSPPNADVKVHSCGDGKNNAIFHGSRGTRNNVVVTWKPPKDFKGDVKCIATFVRDFDTFWTLVDAGSKVSVA